MDLIVGDGKRSPTSGVNGLNAKGSQFNLIELHYLQAIIGLGIPSSGNLQ